MYSLAIPEIKIISFERNFDQRGYFMEHFRKSEFIDSRNFEDIEFVQCNESFSKYGTIRGLHFQWNPFMGKLVRTIAGNMIDIILDIRKGSPSFGKIIMHQLEQNSSKKQCEWIWIPPGFAHGNFFLEDSIIEYLCTGEYNQSCEAGISPLAKDIDWSFCDKNLRSVFSNICQSNIIISDKDKSAFSLAQWENDSRSDNFIFTI